MSDNKPPMTVWLTGKQTPCEATNRKHDVFSPHGPYVHLKQFMEEVERRANRSTFPHFENDDEHTHKAMQELAKEIEEGKA
jgi:hypothetical protein